MTSAEKIVDDRLSQTPELYILALAQFSTQADTEVVSQCLRYDLVLVLLYALCNRHDTTDSAS